MIDNLRHAPLRTKLRFVILATCTAALLIACASLFAVQFYFFRRDYYREFSQWASMIAKATSTATDFDDADLAEQRLNLLGEKPYVRAALIFRQESNKDLARFERTPYDFSKFDRSMGRDVWRSGGDVIFAEPVPGKDKDRVGILFVVADYATPANRLISLYLAIFCGVAAASVLIGLLISTRLARVITAPLQRLANMASNIARSNDYTLRAEKTADDEVGSFAESFNEMLGRIQGRDANLRHEIAERERAEKELQQLHNQLMDASRQAGMAEVATGVLHNVGNVLNSVNVSATIVAEKLNIHRLNNLVRTADLMKEQNSNLGEYLTRDPKGQLIPGYLSELSKHLVTERQEALAELELLTKNIEHIKEIVSMQQNYARVAGVLEQLAPENLMEDALRMTISSLQRHHIEVIRDYEALCPPVVVERHKTLQVLVNLIRNAKHAMDDASPASKMLTLRIRKNTAGFAVLTIVDNGIGISAQNLTKIFSHGFTTRKDGHGFGLHSAALAAQQMGGRITAHSDGPGRGASFTLELPIVKKEESPQ